MQDLDFVCEIHTLQEFAVVSSSIFNSLSRLVARETAAAPSGRRAVGLSRDQDRALGHMGAAVRGSVLFCSKRRNGQKLRCKAPKGRA